MRLALRVSGLHEYIFSFQRNETGQTPSQLAVSASPRVAAPAHPHDTSHRWATTIGSADIGCRAKTLSSPGRHHAWQKYASGARSPDGSAKEGWGSGESHILGRQSSSRVIQNSSELYNCQFLL